jgi:hypothetical protein
MVATVVVILVKVGVNQVAVSPLFLGLLGSLAIFTPTEGHCLRTLHISVLLYYYQLLLLIIPFIYSSLGHDIPF